MMAGLLLVSIGARGAGPDIARARELYQRTDYKQAIETLLTVSPKDPATYALLGKTYYMDGQYKNAISYLEKAVLQDDGNSSYYDWLGKAYGRRAEESSFLTALPYANKTRAAFEKAAALDGSNMEALGDLFEYYLQAPAIVGGGVDKAEGVASRIGGLNPAEYHYSRARLAEKRKDFHAAEQELRMAMDLAPNQTGRVLDLAEFLSARGRYEESDQLFRRAAEMDPDSPKVMFARAAAYIHSGRNRPEAEALLRQYAGSRVTPDDPPLTEVARLLNKSR